MTLAQDFLRELQFFPFIIILRMFHTQITVLYLPPKLYNLSNRHTIYSLLPSSPSISTFTKPFVTEFDVILTVHRR